MNDSKSKTRNGYILGEMTWPEAEQKFSEVDVALLPVGAIEQHGPHLPLDTDSFDADYLCRRVAAACSNPKPIVLPLIPYGVSYHHDEFSGTISVGNESLSRFVYDVGMSAARNGIQKLLIINGHGGNGPTLNFAAQMINRDARIFVGVDSGETSDVDIDGMIDTPNDVHAGEIETSTSLAVRPELVKQHLAKPTIPRFSIRYLNFSSQRGISWYAYTHRFSDDGTMGDPTKASAEKGKKMWDMMTEHLVILVEELKSMSLDEIYDRRGRDVSAFLKALRWLLLPFGIVHWMIVRLRNVSYDRGWRKVYRLPRPVISVGNVQMGGTGKTPMVITLVGLLQESGLRVGVLTRGYARRSRDIILLPAGEHPPWESVGDEPLLILDHLHPGSVLGVGADRHAVGNRLLAQHAVDVFVLDDGMQHRGLHRDVDICLVDASRWSGHPFLFPFSYLRDTRSSLRRAGLVMLTKHEVAPDKTRSLQESIGELSGCEVTAARYAEASLTRLSDNMSVSLPAGTDIAAMCGIANPQHFRNMLMSRGWRIGLWRAWPDHHSYRVAEIEAVVSKMDTAQIEMLVVTSKDAVKLRTCLANHPALMSRIAVLAVALVVDDPLMLNRLLADVLQDPGKNEIRG